MPKRFYDDYSDMYLKNSSLQGRKQHMSGRRHINNKIEYWQMLIREKGLTPPIYPPPPGMVLPMPKLAAAANPTAPALAKLGGDVKGKPFFNENTFGYSAITVKSGMIMALGFLQTYNNAVLERATLEPATFQEVGLGFRV
ncbi:unnamed protein product [Symbiodinium necroappetens]|uniref:U1-C C2H2-type zinc finger domain-containing protein n=1 Tax=Symbiodinium necroappetens TaxID=1628268 RepID=A0A812RAZ3_9DINO|nr:unnamed protein product [Symbiodinium necroappetens]